MSGARNRRSSHDVWLKTFDCGFSLEKIKEDMILKEIVEIGLRSTARM